MNRQLESGEDQPVILDDEDQPVTLDDESLPVIQAQDDESLSSSKECCLPGCRHRRPDYSLHSVRNKNFVGGEKREWAIKMERYIRSQRCDPGLDDLYRSDSVVICSDHFTPEDFDGNMHLRCGAMPSRNLPVKSIPSRQSSTFTYSGTGKDRRGKENERAKRARVEKIRYSTYDSFRKDLQTYAVGSKKWNLQEETDDENNIPITVLMFADHSYVPKYEVTFDGNFEPKVFYYGWRGDLKFDFDPQYATIAYILGFIEKRKICLGAEEYGSAHSILFKPKYVDQSKRNNAQIIRRSDDCVIFDEGLSCQHCNDLKKKMLKKQRDKARYQAKKGMQPLQKIKAGTLSSRLLSTVSQKQEIIRNLEARVKALLEDTSKCIELDKEEGTDLEECVNIVRQNGAMDEFHDIFWNEQIKLNKLEKKSYRYHPELIRYALLLYGSGARAYKLLQDSNILVLPSQRTLRRYRNKFRSSSGFDINLLKKLHLEGPIDDHDHQVMLVFDEMKIKEELVYQASTDKFLGFIDEADTDGIPNASDNKQLATNMLGLYIKGITNSKISYLIGHFGTNALNGAQLASIVLKAMDLVFRLSNLWSLILIADGCHVNRSMFSILCGTAAASLPPFSDHPIDPAKKIFFISDPSHLIKTTRNNVYSSRSASGSARYMWNGADITWNIITDIYETCNIAGAEGLEKLHRITYRHIHLNTFDKMKVSYAAQVLSRSFSNELKIHNHPIMAEFFALMNTFFDICNSSLHQNNPIKHPFYKKDDARLVWLEKDFQHFFVEWEERVNERRKSNGDAFTKTEKMKMLLSSETLNGLKFTATSLVQVTRHMLDLGAPYVILRRISQDVLEGFFGQLRSQGCNRNPNYFDFGVRCNALNTNKMIRKEFTAKFSK